MDVYSAAQPVFQASRLLGFAPFRLVGNVAGKRRLVLSTWILFGSLSFVSLLVVLFVNHGIKDIFNASDTVSALHFVNAQVRIADEILSVVIVVVGCLQSKTWIRFYAGVDLVDKCLATIGVAISHVTAFWLSLATLVGVVSLSVVGKTALRCYFSAGCITGPYTVNTATRFLCESFISVVNNMLVLSFVDSVLMLRQRFALVNDRLAQPLVDEVPEKMFVSRYVDTSLLPTFQTLRRLHDQLCDLAQDINAVFSFQLLLYVATALVNIACQFNNAIKSRASINLNPDNNMASAFMALSLHSVLVTMLNTLCLAGVCSWTHRVANHTSILVSKLLMKKAHSELKQELTEFSIQLLHRKVQFTAFEFFPLDATLIYSIVGGTATSLVILVQFQ